MRSAAWPARRARRCRPWSALPPSARNLPPLRRLVGRNSSLGSEGEADQRGRADAARDGLDLGVQLHRHSVSADARVRAARLLGGALQRRCARRLRDHVGARALAPVRGTSRRPARRCRHGRDLPQPDCVRVRDRPHERVNDGAHLRQPPDPDRAHRPRAWRRTAAPALWIAAALSFGASRSWRPGPGRLLRRLDG